MPAGLGVEGDEVRRGDRAVPWLAHGGGEITLWGLNFLLFGFPFPFPLSSRHPPPQAAVRCLRGVWGREENGNRFLLALVKEG